MIEKVGSAEGVRNATAPLLKRDRRGVATRSTVVATTSSVGTALRSDSRAGLHSQLGELL